MWVKRAQNYRVARDCLCKRRHGWLSPQRRKHLPTRQQKAPVKDEGFCSANQPFGLVIASALVVAVPPIGTACRYSIAIQPAAPATVIPVRVGGVVAVIAVMAIVTSIVAIVVVLTSVAMSASIRVMLTTMSAVAEAAAIDIDPAVAAMSAISKMATVTTVTATVTATVTTVTATVTTVTAVTHKRHHWGWHRLSGSAKRLPVPMPI
jgi:hypothetical protein